MPKISVIMGVYNTPLEYIEQSIESILGQTFQDFEFIICNDCCTDNTFEHIKNKYQKCSKIIWIENEKNQGLAYTLNHCLKYAKGEYIARMDTDDISKVNRFEKQIKVFEKYSYVDVVNCNVDVFDENGIYGERIYDEEITSKNFIKGNPVVHPAVMVKKEAYESVGNYIDTKDTVRNEDYDLFFRMIINDKKIYTLQEKVFLFRENKKSYSRRKYRYRINEYKIRKKYFMKLGFLPRYYIYCIKPLIVGLIPIGILKKIRNKK